MQMHSGQPAAMGKGPIDKATGLEIGKDPAILESWKKAAAEHGVEIVSLCAGSLNKCQIWDRDREVAMRIARQTIDWDRPIVVPPGSIHIAAQLRRLFKEVDWGLCLWNGNSRDRIHNGLGAELPGIRETFAIANVDHSII